MPPTLPGCPSTFNPKRSTAADRIFIFLCPCHEVEECINFYPSLYSDPFMCLSITLYRTVYVSTTPPTVFKVMV